MKKKTMIFAALSCIVLTGFGSAPVHAVTANSSVNTNYAVAQYPLCSTPDCLYTSCHIHDGSVYAGHYEGDGHTYHDCGEISGCMVNGTHLHHYSQAYNTTPTVAPAPAAADNTSAPAQTAAPSGGNTSSQSVQAPSQSYHHYESHGHHRGRHH